ncbi:pentapeptide repeat-containing protein [Aeromonas cavernicola]|uniref:pentapeptide repeat-containing protein n=1 Tax=Aeromonas cavernicola TaxID=1006623 RepID=UPI00191C8212|nr:pentapeptide repeat-containing protein [Aeromonas cavernicola]
MLKISNGKEFFKQFFEKQELMFLEFEGIVFEECEFISCDFTSTTFSQCKFIDCSFKKCNLSLIKVPDSRFIDVAFLNCKLVGVNWTSAYWPSFRFESQISFTKSILNDSSFFWFKIKRIKD